MRRINVLHIHSTGGIGGTEQYINSLLPAFPEDLFDVYGCFLIEEGRAAEDLKKKGITIFFLNMKNGFDIRRCWRLNKLIKQHKIDILHSHGDNVLARFIGYLSGVPIQVNTDHGPTIHAGKFKRKRRVLGSKLIVPITDKYIAISKIMKRTLIEIYKVPEPKIEIIYNGIEDKSNIKVNAAIKEDLGILKDYLVITCIARLTEQKKHKYLLQIAKKVLEKEKKVIFLLIGDGELRSELEKYTNELNINNNVKFLGFRRDVDEILSISDIYVQTSQWEAFSVSLLEAMRARLPIVGFDTDGVNEAILNNTTGYVVPYKDIEVFLERLLGLVRNPEKRINMGKEGYNFFKQNFTVQINAMKITRLYKELLKEKFGYEW